MKRKITILTIAFLSSMLMLLQQQPGVVEIQ